MKTVYAIFVFFFLAVSTMAAEWNFYGSARMATWYDFTKVGDADVVKGNTYALQSNSRLGANVKAGSVSGSFEYGSGPNLRKLYGTWNINDDASLTFGQTYSPLNFFPSDQVWGDDEDMVSRGGVYSGRNPMLQFSYGSYFTLALLPPIEYKLEGLDSIRYRVAEVSMPKIEMVGGYSSEAFHVNAGFGLALCQNVLYPDSNALAGNSDYYSALGLVGVLDIGFNAGILTFGANVYANLNEGVYGLYSYEVEYGMNKYVYPKVAMKAGSPTQVDKIDNAQTFGFLGVLTLKPSDMVNIEGGFGLVKWFHSDDVFDAQLEKYGPHLAWYLHSTLTLTDGVYIVPEVGQNILLKKDEKDDAMNTLHTYVGAKWQINF